MDFQLISWESVGKQIFKIWVLQTRWTMVNEATTNHNGRHFFWCHTIPIYYLRPLSVKEHTKIQITRKLSSGRNRPYSEKPARAVLNAAIHVAVQKKEGVDFGTVPRDIPCGQSELFCEWNFTLHIIVSELRRRPEDKTPSSPAGKERGLTNSAKVWVGRFLMMTCTGVFILISLLLCRQMEALTLRENRGFVR